MYVSNLNSKEKEILNKELNTIIDFVTKFQASRISARSGRGGVVFIIDIPIKKCKQITSEDLIRCKMHLKYLGIYFYTFEFGAFLKATSHARFDRMHFDSSMITFVDSVFGKLFEMLLVINNENIKYVTKYSHYKKENIDVLLMKWNEN